MAQTHEKIKQISTLPINYAARIVGYAIEHFGLSDPRAIADIFNMPLRTVYQGKADYFAAIAESATIAAGCTQCTQPAAIEQPTPQSPHIEERARLKETPTELSSKTEDKKERDMFETDVSNVSPPPRKRAKARRRFAYTPEFEAFWTNYPDTPGTSKSDAFAEWMHLLPAEQELATTSLAKFRADVAARKQKQADFRAVHACRYLSQRRWESYQTAQIITLPKAPVPTRPVNNHRDEGISLEDALARKLITEEQYAKYRSQVTA